jgi:hypothetical protein
MIYDFMCEHIDHVKNSLLVFLILHTMYFISNLCQFIKMVLIMIEYNDIHAHDDETFIFYLNDSSVVTNSIAHMTKNVDTEKAYYVIFNVLQISKYLVSIYVSYYVFRSISYSGIWTQIHPTSELQHLKNFEYFTSSMIFVICLGVSVVIYKQYVWNQIPTVNASDNIWYHNCDADYIPVLNTTIHCVLVLNPDQIAYSIYVQLLSWKNNMISVSILSMILAIINYICCVFNMC